MKILAINGSPRKGNNEFMLDIILNSAKENGTEAELINLRDKRINFCGGGDNCCPKTLKCYISDDMNEIYPKLEAADIIILASPTYFSNVSARMKNFMDRCNPYYYNKKLKSKKFFLISVGGYEPSVKECIKSMENFLKGVYGKKVGSYHAVADKIGELEDNSKIIKALQDIGKNINKNL